jgi:hypothetical protein
MSSFPGGAFPGGGFSGMRGGCGPGVHVSFSSSGMGGMSGGRADEIFQSFFAHGDPFAGMGFGDGTLSAAHRARTGAACAPPRTRQAVCSRVCWQTTFSARRLLVVLAAAAGGGDVRPRGATCCRSRRWSSCAG